MADDDARWGSSAFLDGHGQGLEGGSKIAQCQDRMIGFDQASVRKVGDKLHRIRSEVAQDDLGQLCVQLDRFDDAVGDQGDKDGDVELALREQGTSCQ